MTLYVNLCLHRVSSLQNIAKMYFFICQLRIEIIFPYCELSLIHDIVRKAPISLECDNWRLVCDYFATKINDINVAVSLNGHVCNKIASF